MPTATVTDEDADQGEDDTDDEQRDRESSQDVEEEEDESQQCQDNSSDDHVFPFERVVYLVMVSPGKSISQTWDRLLSDQGEEVRNPLEGHNVKTDDRFTRQGKCKLELISEGLAPDEYAALHEMLHTPERYSASYIKAALADEGESIGVTTIKDHRANRCACV